MLTACLGAAGGAPTADPPPPPGVDISKPLPPPRPAPKTRASTWVFGASEIRYTCDAASLAVPGDILRRLFTAPAATPVDVGETLLLITWEQDGVVTGHTRVSVDGLVVSTPTGAGATATRLPSDELARVQALLAQLPDGCG
jgi:hypothetical protein